MKSFGVRLLASFGLGAAAFVSGAAVEPSPAGAHCGDHAGSCGFTTYESGSFCQFPADLVVCRDLYWNDCSGTCYNNMTAGCCASPSACNDEPCKPGGCGGPCAFYDTECDVYPSHPDCLG